MSEIIWSKTIRNKPMLIYDNFAYTFDKKSGDSERWRCRKRWCKGRLVFFPPEKAEIVEKHCHSALENEINIIKINEELKEQAIKTNESSRTVVTKSTANKDRAEIEKLPSRKAMMNTVTRKRNKEIPGFKPKQKDIPEELFKNQRGEVFLRYDSGCDAKERYVIFMSDLQKEEIKNCKVFLIDGTFRSVPSCFYQLITIHGDFFGKFIPFCHILMTSKKQDEYVKVFHHLVKISNISPENIIIDFERALMNSLKEVFTFSKISGCNFHFGQMIWRNIQINGLTGLYKENSNIRKILRMILSLPFFPINEVNTTFNEIQNLNSETIENINLQNFLAYFKKTFISETNQDEEQTSSYRISFWSCFDRVLNEIPRTTNVLEAWHRSLNQNFNIAHPNIVQFIKILGESEERDRVYICQVKSGRNLEISNYNLSKDKKIKVILKNHMYLSKDSYFLFLDNLIEMKTK